MNPRMLHMEPAGNRRETGPEWLTFYVEHHACMVPHLLGSSRAQGALARFPPRAMRLTVGQFVGAVAVQLAAADGAHILARRVTCPAFGF